MKTEIAQFKAAKLPAQYLNLYLSLRANGDNHSAAVETVRGEILMQQLIQP